MRKRVLQRSMDSLERRQLRLVPQAPPDYLVAPSMLQHACIEKEVQLIGTISGLPRPLDCTNRAILLSCIDRAHSSGQIGGGSEKEVILSLSCQNIKINGRYPPEDVILRLATVALEAAVYLRDDHSHLVLLHYLDDDSDSSRLTVLQCEGRMGAEEICALIRQSFQLLYTEATMQFFDRQVTAAAVDPPSLPASIPAAGPESEDGKSLPPLGDRLQEYMQQLHSVLSPSGIAELASLLRQWKTGQMPFRRFLHLLLRLFSEVDSPHMVVGLRPFVPAGTDQAVFEDFLREQGLTSNGHPHIFRRALSHASTISGASMRSSATATAVSADEVDRRLDAALDEVKRLEEIMQGKVGLDTIAKRLASGQAPPSLSAALMPRNTR